MRKQLFLLYIISFSFSLHAQDSDTMRYEKIKEVEVIGYKTKSKIRYDSLGGTSIDLSLLDKMPKIVGSVNPIRFTQLLPSVQTNTELDAGLHIQGCDNSHNNISIDGVHIYNVQHLLGIFSVFNASHFSKLYFSSSAYSAASSNRIGGFIDLQRPTTFSNKITGEFSAGLLSSQGTIRLPIGNKSEFTFSTRYAYINLLYGNWLKTDYGSFRYSFHDLNINWTYCPNKQNTFWLNIYNGGDVVKYGDNVFDADSKINWSNNLLSLNWHYEKERTTLLQTAYVTSYQNKLLLFKEGLRGVIPSSICDLGYKISLNKQRFSVGWEWLVHNIHPQSPSMEGDVEIKTTSATQQHSHELSLWGNYKLPLMQNVNLLIGVRNNLYTILKKPFLSTDPLLSVLWTSCFGQFRLTASMKHQYLFRTGFTSLNMPTEFWVSADKNNQPQYAYGVSTEYKTFLSQQQFQLTVGLYYKRLYHQMEFIGSVFDYIQNTYDFNQKIVRGKGVNYGLNVMLEKRTGNIMGWLSYSWGRALRHYPGTLLGGTYPASHERIHEFNAVATWDIDKHWQIGTTLVWAGGTPFTPPRYFYLQNANLITQLSEYNSARLSTYIRLDVSVSYLFQRKTGFESGVNLSIYNANCRNNDIFWRLKFNEKDYSYEPVRTLPSHLPFLPSISYYIKF